MFENNEDLCIKAKEAKTLDELLSITKNIKEGDHMLFLSIIDNTLMQPEHDNEEIYMCLFDKDIFRTELLEVKHLPYNVVIKYIDPKLLYHTNDFLFNEFVINSNNLDIFIYQLYRRECLYTNRVLNHPDIPTESFMYLVKEYSRHKPSYMIKPMIIELVKSYYDYVKSKDVTESEKYKSTLMLKKCIVGSAGL